MIQIIDIENDEMYVIEHTEQARDEFDKHLAELCIEHNDVITMGKFIAREV